MPSACALRGVTFRYPGSDFELRVPQLRVDRGERVAVIGPSGTGKTTLLHLIAGVALPETGAVETAGLDLLRASDAERRALRARRLGLVFQEFELLSYLSVRENILLPYRMSPALRLDAEARARADRLAEQVGLGDKLGRTPDRLSHGERQRAALCRALVTEPELILADEPTGNLDPTSKQRALDVLFEYADGKGAALLTVTHDHDLLPSFERVVDFKSLGAQAA